MSNSKRTVILFNPRNMRGVGEDSSPPMGLLMAAMHVCRKFRVVIVDQRIEINWQARLKKLLGENPVCFGVTSLTGNQIKKGLNASMIAKNSACPVVWGGIHASLLPEQTLSHQLIDYVVGGEGEETFLELVEALASGKPCNKIPGVWSKENGIPTFGGQRKFLNINKLPPVPYDLIDIKKYIKIGPYGNAAILYSSRGCPQRCKFCCNQPLHKFRWRAFSPDYILEEVKYILNIHPDVRHFQFWDNNFFVNHKRSKQIAENLGQLRPSISWSIIGAHVRDIFRMDNDYLRFMRDNGLKEVLIGVESGSQKILDSVQKNFDINELIACNRRLGKHNIGITCSFMSGFPEENDEDMKKTIELMFRLKKDNPKIDTGSIKPFICYPGTDLYEKALLKGFTPPKDLEEWSNFVWGNYLNTEISTLPRERKKNLTWLYYYTILMNPNYIFINSKLFVFVASILKPIATMRVKNLWLHFPVEARLMHFVQKLISG